MKSFKVLLSKISSLKARRYIYHLHNSKVFYSNPPVATTAIWRLINTLGVNINYMFKLESSNLLTLYPSD